MFYWWAESLVTASHPVKQHYAKVINTAIPTVLNPGAATPSLFYSLGSFHENGTELPEDFLLPLCLALQGFFSSSEDRDTLCTPHARPASPCSYFPPPSKEESKIPNSLPYLVNQLPCPTANAFTLSHTAKPHKPNTFKLLMPHALYWQLSQVYAMYLISAFSQLQ